MERNKAWDLLRKYNKEPFHLRHALTVEGVMRYFAEQRGEDADFWGVAGLLHDIDFEMWNTAGERLNCCARAARMRRLSTRCAATAGENVRMWSPHTRWKSCCLLRTS